ncbi:MAG: PAAR-like domain-containing protein [Pseudomonadota bacterium]
MGNQVYANNMEVVCKAADGKSICAFPDVCFTPPQTPATPPGVPIPYPNTGMASDCTEGSKTVQVSGQEVMLKNKSYFKKSTGNEAGCAPKKGAVTSKNAGKVYFNAWSMDVKMEGENVVRHFDLTTHNHGSVPSNTGPWPYIDAVAMPANHPCKDDPDPECKLVPYDPGCPGGKTPHHAIPVHCFMGKGARKLNKAERIEKQFDDCKNYNPAKAPCVCVDGKSKTGLHGEIHEKFDKLEDNHLASVSPRSAGSWSYADAKDAAAQSISEADLGDGKKCSKACIEQQVKNYHEQKEVGIKEDTALRADSSGRGTPSDFKPSVTDDMDIG